MSFKMIEKDTGKELKSGIIVLSEYGSYDIYENKEDCENGIDIIEKRQEYYDLVMTYN